MKPFMDENFLLQTETAQKLYHEHAAKMPIIDYHCHLIPKMVADDHRFKSITEIGLAATTTNGAQCAPTVLTNVSAPAPTLQTGKNLKNGPKQFPTPSATPSTTGHTSNLRPLSALTSCSTPKPPARSSTNVTTSSSTTPT